MRIIMWPCATPEAPGHQMLRFRCHAHVLDAGFNVAEESGAIPPDGLMLTDTAWRPAGDVTVMLWVQAGGYRSGYRHGYKSGYQESSIMWTGDRRNFISATDGVDLMAR